MLKKKMLLPIILAVFMLGLANQAIAGNDWFEGKVTGVDVFDSDRARFTLKNSGGSEKDCWIRFDRNTGSAMLATVLSAATTGVNVKVFKNADASSFGGQSGYETYIIFSDF
jgi:hypothetical protein